MVLLRAVPDPLAALNVFYLLTFPAVACTAVFAGWG